MNGIANITINGNIVRLKFGLPAVKRIFEKMAGPEQMTEQEGDEKRYTYFGMAQILFAGYCNGCLLEEKVPSLAFEDFYEFIEQYAFDQTGEKEITDALRAFEESRFVKNAAEKTRAEEKKSALKQSH